VLSQIVCLQNHAELAPEDTRETKRAPATGTGTATATTTTAAAAAAATELTAATCVAASTARSVLARYRYHTVAWLELRSL